MDDKQIFLDVISRNYDELKGKYRKHSMLKGIDFSDDIFQESILKCYDAIERKGHLNDNSEYGCMSYFFKSLNINLKRDKQYSRNSKRDLNITSDEVMDAYEEYSNDEKLTLKEKLMSDLKKDFSTLYILRKVEENFPSEDFYLFKLKYLVDGMTYKKLTEKTKLSRVRQRVVDIKNWIKENITKKEIDIAFHNEFNEIF